MAQKYYRFNNAGIVAIADLLEELDEELDAELIALHNKISSLEEENARLQD